MSPSRLGLPDLSGRRPLVAALAIDALGSGLFLPFAVLFFTLTTPLSLAQVGLALSVAAGIALPAAPVLGSVVDRWGAWQVLLAGNALQALGTASYLFVDTFAELVAAAGAAALGNQAFWASFPPLIAQISDAENRERWFGLVGAIRNAGFAVGGLVSGVGLSVGGDTGYRVLAGANAASFVLATLLLLVGRPGTGRTRAPGDGVPGAAGGWLTVLSDRAYLSLAAVNVAFALNSLALAVLLPVHSVLRLGLPPWLPGVALTLNFVLIAAFRGPVVHALTGRSRRRALQLSSALSGGFATVMYLSSAVPGSAAIAVVLAAGVLFTLGELIEAPVMAATAAEAAPEALRGRYMSVHQLSWSVAETIAPAALTGLFAAGRWQVWWPAWPPPRVAEPL